MILNHRHRFLFVHVPKTGGTSVQRALLAVEGSWRPKGTKHLTRDEYLAAAGAWRRWRARGHRSFGFVRNPWERFGSAHRYHIRRGGDVKLPEDLDEAARRLRDGDPRVLSLWSMRPQVMYARGLEHLGRYEALEADFARIGEALGFRAELPHANASGPTTTYAAAMAPETVDILAEVYREDVEAFGYRPLR